MLSRKEFLAAPLYLFAVSAPLSVSCGAIFGGVIVGFAVLAFVFARNDVILPPRPVVLFLFIFLSVHVLATALAAPLPVNWTKCWQATWLKLFIIAIPLVYARQPDQVDRAVKTLIVSGAIVVVYAGYQHFTGIDYTRDNPLAPVGDRFLARGFFNHHITYSGHVLLLLVTSLAWLLFGHANTLRQRLLVGTATAALYLGLLWSGSRSAMAGVVVGVVVFLLMSRFRVRRWLFLGLALAVLFGSLTPMVRTRFAGLAIDQGQETRINLWRCSLSGILDRPLLGWGYGNFEEMLDQHLIRGYYDTRCHAHNEALMMAVDTGLLGLGAGLALGITVIVVLWRRRHTAGRQRWLVLGAICMQISIAVAGLVQVFQTDDEVEVVFYFILGCALAVMNSADQRETGVDKR